MYQHPVPQRVRVLILGGGIHGVGVFHDLASRGWKDIFLVEKCSLGNGTSSKSTKLIHGGLRYLRQISQFSMVKESLRERSLLLTVAPDIVRPIELIFPIQKNVGESSWLVKIGLSLYDFLAGQENIEKNKSLSHAQASAKIPHLNVDKFTRFYSFWDAQTDDLALVHRVAASGLALGGGIAENTEVLSVEQTNEGFLVSVQDHQGNIQKISCLFVINCLGPWANTFLEKTGLKAPYQGINNKGSHLVFDDIGLESGLFMQSPADNRICFLLPWLGKTLLGTTEALYNGNPDEDKVADEEVQYLLQIANQYLTKPLKETDIRAKFAGYRWLAVGGKNDISLTSREHLLGELRSTRGFMLTVYGGKLTSYRSLAEKIGDKLTRAFGEFRPSMTKDPKSWLKPFEQPGFDPVARFN